MSSSNLLFTDIGFEVVISEAGFPVDNVETRASSDARTSLDVVFAAAWYCKIGLGTSVPFWDIWLEELTLLPCAFEPGVFFFAREDLSNGKDCGDSAGMPVDIAFGSSITTFFVSSLALLNGNTLLDDVCDAKPGSTADWPFDTCRESEASSDVDFDEMFSFDTGFKLCPSFDFDGSKQII